MIEKNFELSMVSKDLSKRQVKDVLYFIKKVLNNRKWAVRLIKLCHIANVNSFAGVSKRRLNSIVLSVSSVQPSFTKYSVCVQMYDDTDDDMRWAVNNGALAIVTDHHIDGLPCILVNSPIDAYAKMCRYYRDLSSVSVTAVTGSIGKTTVKRMINEVYSAQYET